MKIKTPKYGWFDLGGRVCAWIALVTGLVNLPTGTPWSIAWAGFALGMFACVHVERLREDLRRAAPADSGSSHSLTAGGGESE